MKLYADQTGWRARQIASDLAVVVWVAGGAWLGQLLRAVVSRAGRHVADAATAADRLAGDLHDAAGTAGSIPLVGDRVGQPIEAAARSATGIAHSLHQGVHTMDTAATALGLVAALLVIAVYLAVWIPLRIRFVRRATRTERYLATGGGPDLLALRAIARAPLDGLSGLGPDPVGGWRSGDQTTIDRLATIELRHAGIERGRSAGAAALTR